MPMAPDDVPDWTWWGAIGAVFLLVGQKWLGKLNPWPLFQMAMVSLNGPLMEKYTQPIRDEQRLLREEQERQGAKLDKVCRVIDHMDGADAAHAAVRAEDEKERYNWEA